MVSIVFYGQVYGQMTPLAHYQFGTAGTVTYAATDDVIMDHSGRGNDLKRTGEPVFFADAPSQGRGSALGSVLFNGQSSYRVANPMKTEPTRFVLEVWAKATDSRADDSQPYPVLSYGDMSEGYVIAQQRGDWVVIRDGRLAFTWGPVATDEWVHLAIAIAGDEAIAFMDGQQQGDFTAASNINNSLFIAHAGSGSDFFSGLIYEARLSQLEGGLSAVADGLLVSQQQSKTEFHSGQVNQRELIRSLTQNRHINQVHGLAEASVPHDWLVHRVDRPSEIQLEVGVDASSAKLMLTNGLVSRTFDLGGNLACVSYKNLGSEAEYVRAIKPEARVQLDSTWYDIGGLTGQPEKSYLMESWYDDLEADETAFRFSGLDVKQPEARYPWQQKYNAVHADWPPKGLHVIMHYRAPAGEGGHVAGLAVEVHYEIYDGIPVMAKWVQLSNGGQAPVIVTKIETEVLAVAQDQVNRIHVESDYSFALANADPQGSALMHYQEEPKVYQAGRSTTKWEVDRDYNTWASHNQAEDNFLRFPHRNLLLSSLPMGPSERVDIGGYFKSFVTFEMLHDSDDKERQSLAHRRFYRTLAPQVTESLLRGGITSQDPQQIKGFIDQLYELGFEGLDIMAWPGISHDNLDPAYVEKWADIASYAKARGITMGGYELQVASRGRGAEVDAIHPETGKPGSVFGQSVCIASAWKDSYYANMWTFFDRTGLLSFNMDGPYHGDPCASDDHPYHRGLADLQWEQWKTQVAVIHELQRRNMSVPIPDWYFLNGQSATGMGYREATANLTPQQQMLLGRQYVYDGTWHKAPTMGWMTLQLVGFYTNDPKVGLEPLAENIENYENQLFQYLASGCQLTVRGNRLYDTPETKAMVKKWVGWFKKHREILTSDIIHVGRPTGRDLDVMFHVNPFIEEKGLAAIFNPTDKPIKKEITLPLYYTGLTKRASIVQADGSTKRYRLDKKQHIEISVEVPAGGFTWLIVK